MARQRRGLAALMPWWLYGLIGHWRRRRGYYDALTRFCLLQAWRRHPSLSNHLRYLRFRRDLGLPPPSHQLERLAQGPLDVRGARRFVVNGKVSMGGLSAIGSEPTSHLLPLVETTPAAAAEISRRGTEGGDVSLASLYTKQAQWQREFARFIRSHAGDICVVGNAPLAKGDERSAEVERFGCVVRFNNYSRTEDDSPTTGEQLNVWMVAPGIAPPYPPASRNTDWVIVSGADSLFRLDDWRAIAPLVADGKPVLSVPLAVWRSLVRTLEAPPSAGVLCLAWLIELLGEPGMISILGFQLDSQGDGRPRSVPLRHWPRQRHNWSGERELLIQWQRAGLRLL